MPFKEIAEILTAVVTLFDVEEFSSLRAEHTYWFRFIPVDYLTTPFQYRDHIA
jgi:hypothetical protein